MPEDYKRKSSSRRKKKKSSGPNINKLVEEGWAKKKAPYRQNPKPQQKSPSPAPKQDKKPSGGISRDAAPQKRPPEKGKEKPKDTEQRPPEKGKEQAPVKGKEGVVILNPSGAEKIRRP